MKEQLWQIAVRLWRLWPARLLGLVCRLSFAAAADRRNAKVGLSGPLALALPQARDKEVDHDCQFGA